MVQLTLCRRQGLRDGGLRDAGDPERHQADVSSSFFFGGGVGVGNINARVRIGAI